MATDAEISLNTQARDHFAAIIAESDFNSLTDFWERGIDMRAKLSLQRFTPGMWIAVYGAGGGIPAAGYFQTADIPIIIDQTLYWAECTSEDEAVYFCGIVNSRALLQRHRRLHPRRKTLASVTSTLSPPRRYLSSTLPTRATVLKSPRRVASSVNLAAAAKASDKVAQLFTTEVTMNSRRTRLRKTMKDLEAYEPYEAACAAVIAAATPGYTIESNRE